MNEENLYKNKLYLAFLEAEKKDSYIKGLAEFLSEVTPRGLSQDEKRQYAIIREAILACYFLVELILNKIITFSTLRCLESEVTSHNIDIKFEQLFDCWIDIPYKKKVRLIKNIYQNSNIDFEVLNKLDDFRDMFAHNFPLKNKRYNYDKNNIVKVKRAKYIFFEKLHTQLLELKRLKDSKEKQFCYSIILKEELPILGS